VANGTYVVSSPLRDSLPGDDAGAATFGPLGGVTGHITATNSAF